MHPNVQVFLRRNQLWRPALLLVLGLQPPAAAFGERANDPTGPSSADEELSFVKTVAISGVEIYYNSDQTPGDVFSDASERCFIGDGGEWQYTQRTASYFNLNDLSTISWDVESPFVGYGLHASLHNGYMHESYPTDNQVDHKTFTTLKIENVSGAGFDFHLLYTKHVIKDLGGGLRVSQLPENPADRAYHLEHYVWDGEHLTRDGQALPVPTAQLRFEHGPFEYGFATLLKVELISPAGNHDNDPVAKPIDGGDGTGTVPDGANEFTFSSAADGVLTIQFKAEVGGGSTVLDAIKDKVTFTIEDVGQAPTWDAANPSGKASVSGNYLVATATFTGLPANNSDFGKKKVQLLVDGSVAEESEIEVFFPRDATNHPMAGAGITPNWFFYWNQLSEAQGHNLNYGGAHSYLWGKVTALFDWSYLNPKDKTEIVMYDGVVASGRSYGVGILLSGVDNYIGTVIHEAKHVDQITRADALLSSGDSFQYGWSWNQPIHNHWSEGPDGEWGVSGVDDDSDSIVDNAKAVPPFEPGNGDDVNLDHPSYPQWPNAWSLPSPNNGPHPIESEAINATDNNYSEHKNARNDWADPGKNHETKDKWND